MGNVLRVATWNMKQAVAPKKPLDELWRWVDDVIEADVIVLTEAKVPKDGLPRGWNAIWTPDGIGPRRRWGTVVAARDYVTISPASFERNVLGDPEFSVPLPATVHTVDVDIDGERWGSVVGAYGFLHDGMSGLEALEHIADEAHDAYSSGRERLVLAGDLNLWPIHALPLLVDDMGFVDAWSNVEDLAPLEGAVGGSRIWTHRNGNSERAARQEIDYVLFTDELAEEVDSVSGGIGDFPESWEMSDHAPVAIDFEI